jgi:hypothetical protein
VAALESTHNSLCHSLDTDLTQGKDSGAGGVAATIMRASSNMHRLLAIHQLFHVAIMHNLMDQQLAHLCVRCFPRFPCMQDLLNALVRIREGRGKGLDLPERPGSSSTGRGHTLGSGAASGLGKVAALKPPSIQTSVLSKGRLAEAGSKMLHGSSGLLSNGSAGGAAVREEARSAGGGEDADAAATAEQAMPKSPMSDLAHVVKGSAKDWDVQYAEAGSLTPVRPNSSMGAQAPGSSYKRPRSPAAAAGGSNRMGSSSGSKPAKKMSFSGGAVPAGYASGSSSAHASNKRSKAGDDGKWPPQQQQQQQGMHGQGHGEGVDVGLAAVAAAAAAGMPVDPAAAAALPVPLEHLPAAQARPSNGANQSTLPAIQQLAAYFNAVEGPQDMMQLLASQPKLALLLQHQPQLLGALQEAMLHQQQQAHQQQQVQQHGGMPDLQQAAMAAAQAGQSQQQQQQQGFPAPGRLSADGLAQQQSQQWQAGAQAAYGAAAAAGGRPNGIPSLEMLPPSLVATDAPGSNPMQTLFNSLSTLLQACSSVTDAATAVADMGQGEFVLSAVSAAEAAITTAFKGLADIKARCTRGYPASLAAAAAAAGSAGAGMAPAHGAAAGLGLPPASPSSSRLQPPAGIPMPGPQASQQMLPQSLSLALSGMHSAEVQPHSNTVLLAGMGVSASQQQQQLMGAAGTRPQSGPNSIGQATAAAATQQQLPVSALVQQLSSISGNPAAIAQLMQVLQQQQQLTPEISAVLAQLVGQASSGSRGAPAAAAAAAADGGSSGIAALMQQIQQQAGQAAGMKQVPSSAAMAAAAAGGAAVQQASKGPAGYGAWGARQGDGLPALDAAAAAAGPSYPQSGLSAVMAGLGSVTAIQALAACSRDMTASYAAPLDAAAAAVGASGGAALPPGSAAAAAAPKEDSGSAGSSTTITGQSGRQQEGQPGPVDPATQAAQQQGLDHQQLERLAMAAAAAMGGQLQAPRQAEAFVGTVMQLLQGQGGADGASMGAVAGILQAMTGGAAGHGLQLPQQQQQQQHYPLAAPDAAEMAHRPMGQSAAAAAMMIPPAAAAAMAAIKASVAAAPVGNVGRQQAADLADLENDAASALDMLAAAAVSTQHEGPAQRKKGVHRDG